MRGSGTLYGTGDRHWRGNARFALCYALGFWLLILLVDWNAGTLTPARALMWLALSAAAGLVLLPHHVTAAPGSLTVHGTVRRRTVRTDALVGVRHDGDVCTRLVLTDTDGQRVEIDPRVLFANPLLWHELETGAHRSLERGTLLYGAETVTRLGRELDESAARAVLKVSGLS